MSGSTASKLNYLLPDPGINELAFRLMHLKIAGENPHIRDIRDGKFSLTNAMTDYELFEHFNHVEHLKIIGLNNTQLSKLFDVLVNVPMLKSLSFEKLESPIPTNISKLKQLEVITTPKCQWDNVCILSELSGLKVLELSNVKVENSSWLQKLTQLEELKMSKCSLNRMPEEVYGLFKLKVLVLNSNSIEQVSSKIKRLTSLEVFSLKFNKLKNIPIEIFQLKSLIEIGLKSNHISRWDMDGIRKILGEDTTAIRKLDLSNNQLEAFELHEDNFEFLDNLNLSNNRIDYLDERIWQLKYLEVLRVHHNQISEFTGKNCDGWRCMKTVDLSNNKIEKLPEFIYSLRVSQADLSYNNIQHLESSNENEPMRRNWNLEGNPVYDQSLNTTN